MSLGGRATKGGTSKGGNKQAQEKAKTADKPQPKEKVKPQATTEQIRLAQMMDRKSADPSEVRKMVLQLMEMTCKSEEEVCCALHDSDNDMSAACYLLLDDSQHKQSEWQTNEKKKKKPAVPGNNGDIEPQREPRARSGPRPRRGETDGGRGRGGRGRGGRGGRGRRSVRGDHNIPTDLGHQSGDPFPNTEDWENEEWSGSLSDSKVFTPTVKPQILPDDSPQSLNTAEDWDAIPETNNGDHIPSYTYHNTNHVPQTQRRETQERSPVSGLSNLTPKEQSSTLDSYVTSHQHQENSNTLESYVSSHQHQVNNPMGMSGSLSAAQSQYLSQLTQQTQRHENSVYTSNYGVYGSPDISTQRKTTQRARVPPPSKIPMTAVEMPAGVESTFLDVTFGEPEPAHPVVTPVVVPPLPEPPVVAPVLETTTEPTSYSNSPSIQQLTSEQLTVTPTVEPIPPPPTSHATPDLPPVTTVSLENQLSATMKQLSVGVAESTTPHYSRHKQPTYAPHHPPVYNPNVYAQVNSTTSSLSAVPSAMNASYPPAVTLSQYQQPAINYQQTSSSASVYGGSALYTAAPYNTYQHHQPQQQHHHHSSGTKDPSQYDTPVSSTNNSLSSTTSTHTTTAKVTTTTVSSAVSASSVSGAYVPQPAQYYGYDDQMMRGSLPHHMGGYYEVGYGRDGFGLSGERFARTENASPQQVAVPAGYAYFYQPPPNTYQYGVYPQYGSGGGVGNVSAASGGKVSSYQQPTPYETQDNYKSGPYTANANKTAAAPAADITNAMYAKAHVALNKVNSYDKAAFHSGTPPPFSASHVYIPSHHPLHHTQHQMDMRLNNSHSRRESGPTSRGSNKPAASKQYNAQSYWSN